MPSSKTPKILLRLSILCILASCLWLFSGRASQTTTQVQGQINVTLNPLQSENEVQPVEIRCEPARLLTPSQLAGFSCTLKNNTNKNITAANLIYSILLDSNGVPAKDTHSLTIETLIHQDFHETKRPIVPNAEQVIGSMGKISYEAAVIKGIEIGVDYVEFEDGTTLGPDEAGSKIIADMREGARKYKKWLAQEYIKQGKSISPCFSLLQSDQPLPNAPGELAFGNADEKNGAKAYQGRLRKICSIQGAAAAEKYLPK